MRLAAELGQGRPPNWASTDTRLPLVLAPPHLATMAANLAAIGAPASLGEELELSDDREENLAKGPGVLCGLQASYKSIRFAYGIMK